MQTETKQRIINIGMRFVQACNFAIMGGLIYSLAVHGFNIDYIIGIITSLMSVLMVYLTMHYSI